MRSVTVEFTRVTPGAGPNADLCLSGVELRRAGRAVNLRMPRAAMYYDGLEGCNASYLIRPDGRMLDGIAVDVGYSDEWSPDGRYVCGLAGGGIDESKAHLWIADARQGKIIKTIYRPDMDYKWTGASVLVVSWPAKGKTVKRFIKVL